MAAAFLVSGCIGYDYRLADKRTRYLGVTGEVVVEPSRPPFDTISYWDDDGVPGHSRVVIRLAEQRAYFYRGHHLVGVSILSTGREGFRTPTGNFKIIQKNRNHRSNLYGDYVDSQGNVIKRDVDVKKDRRPPGTRFVGAPMPYFMRIHGGVGIHAGFLPGYPASHGCIRMPEFMARNFYHNVSVGTPVTVAY